MSNQDVRLPKLRIGRRVDGHLTLRDEAGFIVAYVNPYAESFKDKKDRANAERLVKGWNAQRRQA